MASLPITPLPICLLKLSVPKVLEYKEPKAKGPEISISVIDDIKTIVEVVVIFI